jgi:hypothetical protein
MPCYTVRTVEVAFKVGNIDLLKKALEKAGAKDILLRYDTELSFYFQNTDYIKINLETSKIISSIDEKKLIGISNQIKRAYSLEVINELARKQKWIQKKMGENQYQLQRF